MQIPPFQSFPELKIIEITAGSVPSLPCVPPVHQGIPEVNPAGFTPEPEPPKSPNFAALTPWGCAHPPSPLCRFVKWIEDGIPEDPFLNPELMKINPWVEKGKCIIL